MEGLESKILLPHWVTVVFPERWPESRITRRDLKKSRLDGITDSMDVRLNKLQEEVKNREAWRAAVHGVTKSQT